MTPSSAFKAVEQFALCKVRVWWRPITCIGIAGGVVIHGIYLPLMRGESLDLTGWAAVIAACAPVLAVREWGKSKGLE